MDRSKKVMKTIKKNILAGLGRAIGALLVYGAIALTIKLLGYQVDITKLPPTIEGEITSTMVAGFDDH